MRYSDLFTCFIQFFVLNIHKEQTKQLFFSLIYLRLNYYYTLFLVDECMLNFTNELLSDNGVIA